MMHEMAPLLVQQFVDLKFKNTRVFITLSVNIAALRMKLVPVTKLKRQQRQLDLKLLLAPQWLIQNRLSQHKQIELSFYLYIPLLFQVELSWTLWTQPHP